MEIKYKFSKKLKEIYFYEIKKLMFAK